MIDYCLLLIDASFEEKESPIQLSTGRTEIFKIIIYYVLECERLNKATLNV